MITTRLSLLASLLLGTLLVSSSCLAAATNDDSAYAGVKVWRGTVVSVGRIDPTENIGTGNYFDINYSSVALNVGIATKRFGDDDSGGTYAHSANTRVNNVYAGVGFSRILQLQYGYGNEKGVFRVRSDINARAIIDFLTSTHTPKRRLTLGDRLTFTFTVERYLDGDHDVFDNASWGIGLLF